LETAIWVIHVVAAVGVIGLVLLQQGKGADMGAAFGSGTSGSLFGASGSTNFLSRTTAVLATVFFMTSLGLTYLSSHQTASQSVVEKVETLEKSSPSPATTATPAAIPATGESSKAKEIPK